jgi:DNA-binding Lrp family transcriptional regulator
VHSPLYEGLDARHADILQYLQRGAASATEIAAALGVDVDSVLARCEELERAGLIELGREVLIRCA